MNKSKQITFGLASLLTVLATGLQAETSTPKLILQITVDQLRADLPKRYLHRMGKGGFNYLYSQGVVYNNAHHNHANTETIVGHVTLATGATPAVHGMIGNVWFDREDNRLIYNIEDADYPLLSKNADVDKETELDATQKAAKSSGRSPRKIRVSTFSDELALDTLGKSKIFAVSVKDRGAVSMAGHAGKAYWFSKQAGEFVTSSYYHKTYPQWIVDWNEQKKINAYNNKSWDLMQQTKRYDFADKDDQPWEIDLPGYGRVFPHNYGDTSSKYFTTLLTLSPAGDELTADFAKTLMKNEKIGQDDVSDYLAVSFSSTDYVGHMFGSSSLEMEDNLLRLDKTIASLLKYIDKHIGLDNTLIVLSADHGATDPAPYAEQYGITAKYINPKKWNKPAGIAALNKSFGIGEKLVETYHHPYVYLNYDVIEKHDLELSVVEKAVSEEMLKFPGVALAVPGSQILSGNLPDTDVYNAIVNNHNPKRSGDIFIVFEPHSFINDMEGTIVAGSHGSPWKYDSHVPIIFAGHKIAPKMIDRRVNTIDIAPTLTRIMATKVPSGSEGEILSEVTNQVVED